MRSRKQNQNLPQVCGKSFSRALLLISAAALVLRLLISWEIATANGGANNVFAPPATSDLATYISLAKNITSGNFPEVFYYQPYYYAVFLPLIFFVFNGFAIYATIIIQSVLGALTVFITGKCAENIFGARAGIVSALLTAISVPLLLYVPFCQNETLQTFHLILLFFTLLNALKKQRFADWALCGAVAGIAILTRGNIWLLLPAIIIPLIISGKRNRENWKKVCAKIVVFAVIMLIVQLPFIIYNSVKCGKLTGPSTAANAVLALGNTPEAPAGGRDAGLSAGAMYYPEAFHRVMKLTEGEYGKSVAIQMWEWLCREPGCFIELQFRKALLFWDGREIPNNVSLEYDGFCSTLLRWNFIGTSMVLLPLGLAGLLWFTVELFRKRDEKLMALYGFVLLFYLSVVLFYMLSRFRAPVLPLIFIFGGGFAASALDWYKAKNTRERKEHLLGIVCVLLFSILIVTSSYDFYRYYVESRVMRFLRPDGVVLTAGGDDVQYFDHGPKPWGGWVEIPVTSGMLISKQFPFLSSEQGKLQLMVRNIERAEIVFGTNDNVWKFNLPETLPGKSPDKKIVIPAVALKNGRMDIKILSVVGQVVILADNQRDYGRSYCSDTKIDAEWVMRFCVSE